MVIQYYTKTLLNSLLNKITIYVTSTFPVKLRAPKIVNNNNKSYTYLYFYKYIIINNE